jgi:hypothetical protein
LLLSNLGFIKNISSFINTGSQFLLLLNWQMDHGLALFAATTVILFFAFIALDKKQVAGVVYTVYMCVGRFAALVAMGNDLIGYPFT